MPVARKLWQVDGWGQPGTPGASPDHLEDDLPVHPGALEPGLRDVDRLEQGAFGEYQRPVASMYSPRYSTSRWCAGT